jgi:hypothetical protein
VDLAFLLVPTIANPPTLHAVKTEQAIAIPGRVAVPFPTQRAVRRPRELVSQQGELLLLVGMLCAASALLVRLPLAIGPDTWLALVAGREVAQVGLPHHDMLTLFSSGHAWIDQQWLAQLGMYGLDRVGGLALIGVVNVALIVGGLGMAVLAARKLGASAASTLRVLPLAAFTFLISTEVRTQAYAYPLFVATIYLLAKDSRHPSRRVYWCMPVLVLWGNLHGSSLLGAGLVCLRGATILWDMRRQLSWRAAAWLRPATLISGAFLSVLATPYGLSILSYYKSTLLNSGFNQYVAEWWPVTSVPIVAAVFFVLAGTVVWCLGRCPRSTTLWERCALLLLAAAAIMEIRHVPLFALGTVIVLPVCIEETVRRRARNSGSHPVVNAALLALASAAVLVTLGASFVRSSSSFQVHYPNAALARVRHEALRLTTPRVLADERYGDWLMWGLPFLRGHLAYDARFELLSSSQLTSLVRLKSVTGMNWKRAARGYRLLVLGTKAEPDAVSAFQHEPGSRTVYAGDGIVVVLRSATYAHS